MSNTASPLALWLALWARATRCADDLARLSLCVALPEAIRSSALIDPGGHGVKASSGFQFNLEKSLARCLAWAATLIPEACVAAIHASARLTLSETAGAGEFIAGFAAGALPADAWLAPEAAFCTAAVLADAFSGAILACTEAAQGASEASPRLPHAAYHGMLPPPSAAATARAAATAAARSITGSSAYAWLLLLLASEAGDTSIAIAADARAARKHLPSMSALSSRLCSALSCKAAVARLCTTLARVAGRPCAEVLLLQVRLRAWYGVVCAYVTAHSYPFASRGSQPPPQLPATLSAS